MQLSTGRLVTMDEFDHVKMSYGFDPHDWVQVEGTPEQVQTLSRRVALGSQEIDRRKSRRAMQKTSRKRNRKG